MPSQISIHTKVRIVCISKSICSKEGNSYYIIMKEQRLVVNNENNMLLLGKRNMLKM